MAVSSFQRITNTQVDFTDNIFFSLSLQFVYFMTFKTQTEPLKITSYTISNQEA